MQKEILIWESGPLEQLLDLGCTQKKMAVVMKVVFKILLNTDKELKNS